jgi:inner membrane protein
MIEPSPTAKVLRAIGIAALLSIGIFVTWMLIYDRKSQSEEARRSIAQGWGGPQTIAGPELSIPYRVTSSGPNGPNGQAQVAVVQKRLTLAPVRVDATSTIEPERRARSIYEVVVYRAATQGRATFALPADLSRLNIPVGALQLDRAEIRFGVSDPRGLSANPRVRVAGQTLSLSPSSGTSLVNTGFAAPIDLTKIDPSAMTVDFAFTLRGNQSFGFAPRAGDTAWRIKSPWANPSFNGGFLPDGRAVTKDGFSADYRIGNLALGRALVFAGDDSGGAVKDASGDDAGAADPAANGSASATIDLMEPVNLYSQVDRATKYGFLFIGFTFLAFLLFDVIGGVRVAPVEYLLAGAALVLFFVLLLAFAEVIGFTAAYVLASVAIASLNTAYSAAVLHSWRRGLVIGAILLGLFATLYVLLSLEAFALLIGSVLLFAVLAGTMYLTRKLDWTGSRQSDAEMRAASE